MYININDMPILAYYNFLKSSDIRYLKEYPTEPTNEVEAEKAAESLINSDTEAGSETFDAWLSFISAGNEFLKEREKPQKAIKQLGEYLTLLAENFTDFEYAGAKFDTPFEIQAIIKREFQREKDFYLLYFEKVIKNLTFKKFEPKASWNLHKEAVAVQRVLSLTFDLSKITVPEYRAFRDEAILISKTKENE